MNRRLVRMLVIAAAAVLVAGLFAACSSSSSSTPTATGTQAAAGGNGNGSGGGSGSGGGGGSGNGGGNDSGGGSGQSVSPTAGTTVLFTVTQGGKTLKAWTLDELKAAVSFASITIDGNPQNGPLLLDVLKASGVTSWTKGEVDGKGPSRAFDVAVPIDASKVDKTWIIDITKRGTVKLAANALPREQWVRDITEIKLQ